MTAVKQGDLVTVNCSGKLANGEVFFNSADHEPLQFTVGEGKMIPDFEQAMEGMAVGDSKRITVPADRAYGPRRVEMVLEVERSALPPELSPKVGDELSLRQENGQSIPVRVTGISESKITLDANHPLAGEDLTFEIEVTQIG